MALHSTIHGYRCAQTKQDAMLMREATRTEYCGECREVFAVIVEFNDFRREELIGPARNTDAVSFAAGAGQLFTPCDARDVNSYLKCSKWHNKSEAQIALQKNDFLTQAIRQCYLTIHHTLF